MKGYTEAPMAWGLTRGMGRVLGLDLAEAVVEGWLSRAELGQMVQACQACGRDADCLGWLSQQVSAPHLPDYCANHHQLEALLG